MQISGVKRSKNTARQAYDRWSHIYDLMASTSEAHFIHVGLEMLAVQPGETVLEVGSGTGKALLHLSTKVKDTGHVYGLDLSWGMLQQARHRLTQAGISGFAHLLQAEGGQLPYQNDSFNAVFMSFTLELFDTPEIPLVLSECRRVLTPGGRLGVVAMQKDEHPGWIVRLYEWLHTKFPAYVDCCPINVQGMISETGFIIEKYNYGSIWGLPLAAVIAKK